MKTSFQSADLSIKDEKENISLKEAIKLFEDVNWKKEIDIMKDLASKEDELCPPWIMFFEEWKFWKNLHIFLEKEDIFMIYFNITKSYKILWFIPSKKSYSKQFNNLPRKQIKLVITDFFQNQDKILSSKYFDWKENF